MLVGEIGISRHEFYYELQWWEVRSIVRGYRKRYHPGWEQARLVAYNARFCMGSKDPLPKVTEWIKFPWEKEESVESKLTDSDISEMQRMIDEENKRLKAEQGG